MNQRRLWVVAAMWLALFAGLSGILLVTGCGGSSKGGSGGTTSLVARGKVSLPAGFKLPLAQLRVVSDSGQAPINANGSFAAPMTSAGARMIQLVDAPSGKVVLLGYADAAPTGSPYSNGAGDLSAKSTADALLFLGVLGTSLAPNQWAAFQASIFGTSFETQVATAISSEIVLHPTAITDGSASIAAAVAAVQNSYVKPAASSAGRPAVFLPTKTRPTIQRLTVSRSDTGSLVEVQPVTTQSTLYVQPNPNGDGIVAVSTSRRRGALFIYKVGVGPDTKHIRPINPPEEFAADVDIEPTEEIGSVYMGIFKGLQGKFAYLPLTNPPIHIPADPIEKIAVYDVVVIGPGSTDAIGIVENTVAPNSAEARAEYDKEWHTALLHSQLRFLFKDVIEPLLLEFVISNAEAGEVGSDDAFEAALESIGETAPGLMAALASGDLKAAAAAFMTAIEENLAGVRAKIIAALARKFVSTEKVDAAVFQNTVSTALKDLCGCFTVIGVINKGIVTADITQAFHDNTSYNNADVWVADVLQPVVTITPIKSYVDTGDPLVHLQVKIQNITDLSPFRFQWSCTNNQGKLESSSSTAGLGTGIIPDSKAVYVTDFTKFAVGNSDTITVAVYNENDLNNSIGTATATVVGAPAPCTTKPPAPFSIGANAPVISLSETSTRPGDFLTVKVAWPQDNARNQFLEVTLTSAPTDFTSEANQREATKLISVDGMPAKTDYKDITFVTNPNGSPFAYTTGDPTAAQTHTLVFKILEPTDIVGNAIPYCSSKDPATGGFSPPNVQASGHGADGGVGATYFSFNENP